MRLPESEKEKHREKENKKLKLELANVKRNLHRWRSREGEALKERMGNEKKKNEKTEDK